MITYFRANDPYRLVAAFLLLVVIRSIILGVGVPELLPELKWQMIGERLGNGAIMYRDLWDYTSPLAAFVYKWLYILFGKSRIPYFVLSTILVIFQAAVFNNVLLLNKAYNQNTYVPAVVYVIFMNAYTDFMTLSPVLMSMTFTLLAINNVFKRMDNTTKDSLFVNTGIFLGIATLFYLPSFLFLIVTMISLVIYTGSILRRMLLLMYGFAIILILASVFYYWHDSASNFHSFYYGSVFSVSAYPYLSWSDIWWSAVVPLGILVFSVFKMIQDGRYINFQVKIQYVMFFYIISGLIAMLLIKDVSTYQLIYFVPFVVFFVSHYLLTVKHWIAVESSALVIVLLIFLNHGFSQSGFLFLNPYADYSGIKVKETNSGESLLILGEDLNQYSGASLATPFLNWQLSKEIFENPNYYDNSSLIYTEFTKNPPQKIVDREGLMPGLYAKIPWIEQHYRPDPINRQTYLFKD